MKRTILIQNVYPTDEETSEYSEEQIRYMVFCAIKKIELNVDMKDIAVISEKEIKEKWE